MAIQSVKYFCGTEELTEIRQISRGRFKAIGGTFSRHNRYGLVGRPIMDADATVPVTRTIEYKKHPSLHKCDARCRHAKGQQCECSCGGQFHGAGD